MHFNYYILLVAAAAIGHSRAMLPYSNVSQIDMNALESLYVSTQGHEWLWRDSPSFTNIDAPNSYFGAKWNFSTDSNGSYTHDPCEENWQGICCSGNYTDETFSQTFHLSAHCSHVFNSTQNGTYGSIHAAVDETLEYLDNSIIGIVLVGYRLNGHIPSEFLNLTSLIFVSICDNQKLVGTIPTEIYQLSKLVYLNLGFNILSGAIPESLQQLSNVTILYLDNNFLEGTIPNSLGQLLQLPHLHLNDNRLEGEIPETLGQLSLLTQLYINGNLLDGTIPTMLGQLGFLTQLYLSYNLLDGGIPTSLGQLSVLNQLYLNNNMNDGSIPGELGFMKLLNELYLNNNFHVGSLPTSLGSMSNIISLYFNNNYLDGEIPTTLGLLTTLQVLSGGNNLLIGALPCQLSGLTNLTTLLLQSNSFTGLLLPALSVTQSKLSTVDLSDNSFSGSFPSAMFQFSSMRSVSLVANCFTGSISSNLCQSRSLQVLALDGLTSGTYCRKHLFGSLSTVYITSSYIQGTIPTCLFNMSSIEVLQMSGNGLSGELPSWTDFIISSNLRHLSLSHNRLGGAIPMSFQLHDFSLLDLSYNKFSGTVDLMNNYFASSSSNTSGYLQPYLSEKQLVMQVNRLSGTLPNSFESVNNIQVVLGNLFTCDQLHQLPVNDPGTPQTQCGSDELNIVLIIWIVMFISAVTICRTLYAQQLLLSSIASCLGDPMISIVLMWTGIILLYGLLGELSLKLSNGGSYATHTFQYAYAPSLAFLTSNTPAVWTLISAMTMMSWVYVMLTHRQSKTNGVNQEIQAKIPWHWRIIVAITLLTLIDWLTMVLANFGYIYTVLHSTAWQSYLAQIALTIFKLTVNGWMLPALLMRISKDAVNQSVLTGLLLCNNLLIPIFTIMCTEPNCFREIFVSAPAVSSTFIYDQLCDVSFSNGDCIGWPAVVQTSYQPPFIYTYQCSSNMLTTYLPVFVMMYTYIGLIQPLITAGLSVANICYKARWALRITGAVGCDIMLPAGHGINDKYFNGSQLSVMFVCHAVTLLTFGTAYPLLSVLICTAICVEAVQWHLLISYHMQSCADTDDTRRVAIEKKLQKSNEGLSAGNLMYECRWMVMTVMALFFSFFLMDMAGDKAGDDWSKIVWAPITMLLWPVMMRIIAFACVWRHRLLDGDEPLKTPLLQGLTLPFMPSKPPGIASVCDNHDSDNSSSSKDARCYSPSDDVHSPISTT